MPETPADPTIPGADPAARRMAGLDTLRGVAILAVIAFHVCLCFRPSGALDAIARLGYNGVQLFFIVSAITMCHMWDQRRGEHAPVRSFFVRRLCRIAPPFWFAIVFYVAWNQWVFNDRPPVDSFDLLTTATFTHGFFPSTINKVVPGGWSIAAEVSFYALFPLMVRGLPTASNRMVASLLAYVTCTALASAIWLGYGATLDHFLYYSLLTQLPVFLVGMLVYSLRVRGERVAPWFAIAALCAWFLLSEACKARGLPGRPGLWAEVALMAAAAAALLGRFDAPVLAFVGRLSYSAYLFHFAVIDVLTLVVPVPVPMRQGSLAFLLAFAATCLLTVAVAWASSKSIESWSMAVGRNLVRRLQPAPTLAART